MLEIVALQSENGRDLMRYDELRILRTNTVAFELPFNYSHDERSNFDIVQLNSMMEKQITETL